MIVTIGENVVDLIKNENNMFKAVPGGSPFNIAICLGRLGHEVSYAMPVSNDFFGDLLIETLEKNNVKYLPSVRPNRPTGLAFVAVDKDGLPNYSFYREGAADVDISIDELPKANSSISHVQIGGSLNLAPKPCGDVLVDWIMSLNQETTVSVDPNVRPILIKDKAYFLKVTEAILSRTTIYRLSIEDAEFMYDETNPDKIIDMLLNQDIPFVIVTLGDQGALLATNNERVIVSPPQSEIKVIDTVAAGDCFLGALIANLSHRNKLSKDSIINLTKEEISDIGKFCVTTSFINCTRSGCNPPNLAEVKKLLANS